MTNPSLIALQDEAREKFGRMTDERLRTPEFQEFIAHIYTKAVEDCREALPDYDDSDNSWNACVRNAEEALTALLPK